MGEREGGRGRRRKRHEGRGKVGHRKEQRGREEGRRTGVEEEADVRHQRSDAEGEKARDPRRKEEKDFVHDSRFLFFEYQDLSVCACASASLSRCCSLFSLIGLSAVKKDARRLQRRPASRDGMRNVRMTKEHFFARVFQGFRSDASFLASGSLVKQRLLVSLSILL